MSPRDSSESPPGPDESRSRSGSIASSTSSAQASPTLGHRKASLPTSLSPPTANRAHRGPSSPSRLFPNVVSATGGGGLLSSSPALSSSSSAASRPRQDSVSSSVSGTTDPTSLEDSGSECMSTEPAGGGDVRESGTSPNADAAGSARPTPPPPGAIPSGLGATRRYGGGPSPISTQDLLSSGVSAAGGSSSGFASSSASAPSSSYPIPISTSIPSSSVRLSTTPLFPSPLAQASGPVEERHGGDDGDSDIEEEDEEASSTWLDKGQASQGAAPAQEPFGEMEFSPPSGTVDLPETSPVSSETNTTPRPTNRSRARASPSTARELSPEQDAGRTARAGRVRAPSTRASGLSRVLNASDGEATPSRRRSRDFNGRVGISPEPRSAGSSPSRPTWNNAEPFAVSPPSPSSSSGMSISPNSASRRSSLSFPRGFQPGSPTNSRSLRVSAAPLQGGMAVPQPFPAAPPPHESIKLQKVPEAVRTALEFRQNSAAYNGEPMSAPEGNGFGKLALGPLDTRAPKTPVATRAPSPTSPPPSHRSSPSPALSRHSSRDDLGALSGSPPAQSTSHASSAFAPLFPAALASPPVPASPRIRDRSRSVAVPFGTNMHPMSKQIPASSSAVYASSAPAPSGLSVSVSEFSPIARRAHAAASSAIGLSPDGPFNSGSRLAAHRMSLAPTVGLGAPGDNTDEYAQIIMSTRNAKMRKWKASGPAISTLDTGASGAGRTFEQPEGDETEELAEAGEGNSRIEHSPPREIEWVDWLDEYRRLKEAKMQADRENKTIPEAEKAASDEDDHSTEGEGRSKKATRGSRASTPSPPKRSDTFQPAEPALAAAQKGKAKATTADFNPFESTSAPPTSIMSQGFLTPNLPMRHDYFPLSAVNENASKTSASDTFQPFPTPTPLSSSDSYDFSPLRSVPSAGGSASSNYGSPGTKRKRNITKLGHKIDAWWSAVRTSFSGQPDEREGRPRRGSTDQGRLSRMPTLEAMPSRTSSHLLRPVTPSTPSLRAAASASDSPNTSRPSPTRLAPYQSGTVPTGPLAPSAKIDSHRRKPSPTGIASPTGEDPDAGAAARQRRHPHLSLNLGPELDQLSPRHRSTSPQPKDGSREAGSTEPPRADVGPQGQTSLPIPVPTAIPSPVDEPRLTPGHSPGWAMTPGLVPSAPSFPLRERKPSSTTPAPVRPSVAKEGKTSSFSMQTVREQIRQRLASAKENCDKELRRIIADISAYAENEMHRDVHTPLPPTARQGSYLSALRPVEADAEDSGSDAVPEASEHGVDDRTRTDSDGGTSRAPSRAKTPRGPPTSPQNERRSSSPGNSSPRRAAAPRQRHLTSAPRDSTPRGERQARSPTASGRSSRSASHSRSHSRPHSPLPPGSSHHSSGAQSPSFGPGDHTPADSTELADSAFILVLQDVITVATEVLDTPITKFTKEPGSCAHYISRVQHIGDAWSENPELPCRGWYVQLLLAIAGLSRVVEWWEAEKGFWSFEEGVDDSGEPILFISKPKAEGSPQPRSRGPSLTSQPSPPAIGQPPASTWTPLGIDLDGTEDSPRSPVGGHARVPSSADADSETAGHVEAVSRVGDLHQAVDTIRAQTLLMELSLNGQLFQYLSSAWQDFVGVDPEECLDSPISDFLYPDDAAVFAEATRQLEADDSHTVEVTFRLRVASTSETSQDEAPPDDLYEAMEGKGMLMLDGLTGSASHTMWVVRPAPIDQAADEASQSLARYGLDGLHWRSATDPSLLIAPGGLLADPILCRICERPTPAWFFEKHNETCNAVHRLEGDISECNDRLREMLDTVERIASGIHGHPEDGGLDYAGIPLEHASAASSPPSVEGRRGSVSAAGASDADADQAAQRRTNQQRVLDHARDILQIAIAISTPSVTDDSGATPIFEQRLLSPNSENNLAAVMRWQRPSAEERALSRLLADTEDQIRFKLNSVNRLRNTILYAEKVRQEWEAKAHEAMEAMQQARESSRERGPSPLPFDSPSLQPVPPDDSPRQIDALDLPRPNNELRRRLSQPMAHLSPPLGADEGSVISSSPGGLVPMSPRIPAVVPSSKTKSSSIKDFKVIKPISKGAFGSVYLAKKITTGDYYAIKVLKKSDMVAKNQVTNVKAERMILMTQADSEFVSKLFYTFQSKDYLYLVMEYLPGGDCAALVKNLGGLPEDWAKRYIAEVVVGLNHLHAAGIVHRDLKPDNLLIDSKGHLKLTDFGLSRIGLLGRQTQLPSLQNARRPSGFGRNGSEMSTTSSPLQTPGLANQSQAGYFGNVPITDSFSLDTPSEGSGSSAPGSSHAAKVTSPPAGTNTSASRGAGVVGPPGAAAETPQKHFVGTPDYLAPESILGVGMDAIVDWWALGVICYEFLYGIPPFHDETPEKVFENILSRKFEWHEDVIELSPEARDFIDRLLVSDPARRLGAKGAEEVKAHPFLAGVDWDNLLTQPVDFVPQVNDPESTDYFDPRGATGQEEYKEKEGDAGDDDPAASGDTAMAQDPALQQMGPVSTPFAEGPEPSRARRDRSETAPAQNQQDDFGTFNFRNLTVLKQANDDVIRKLKDEQANSLSPLQTSARFPGGPSSPSSASVSSSGGTTSKHTRQASGSQASPSIERLRGTRQPSFNGSSTHQRRNSLPSRLRRGSLPGSLLGGEKPRLPSDWQAPESARRGSAVGSDSSSPPSALASLPPLQIPGAEAPSAATVSSAPDAPAPISSSFAVSSSPSPVTAAPAASRMATIDCLVAGRNPIVTKVLETMLNRLGCRVVVVPNGAEAILAAGGIPFDVLFLDLAMPVVDGEKAARMIKSTVNPSSESPIVAVCSQKAAIDDATGTLFAGILCKPIMKADLLAVLSHLGFKLEVKSSEESEAKHHDESQTTSAPEEHRSPT